MGMDMTGEHCPNCGEDLDEGQIGLCEDCGGDRLGLQVEERCADCNELRDETSNSTHQQWECCACGSWNDNATHGSPELDADARKLEAMGQDAGPVMADFADAPFTALVIATIGTLAKCIEKNQRAWEGEEDSVQAEHRDLMNANRGVLVAYELLLERIKEASNGK